MEILDNSNNKNTNTQLQQKNVQKTSRQNINTNTNQNVGQGELVKKTQPIKKVFENNKNTNNSQTQKNQNKQRTNNNNVVLNNTKVDDNNKQNDEVNTNQDNSQNQVVSVKHKNQKSGQKVKITFLGGVGEIGKNMTCFEYGNDMIVVDAGLAFPGDELPGVDVVVPDITYLVQNKAKLRAYIITHGHEDHIGGIPFVLSEANAPIYGTALTLGLIENKLREYPKIRSKLITVKPKNVLKIGPFTIEFINVNHSIAGALALCITTPCGNIIHTGDFKVDFEPVHGETTDLVRFGEIGRKGVNLLMCESTNVCRPGYTMTESNVGRVLDGIFEKHKEQRLFVATFASNIHRMQQVLNLAEKYGRKVAFSGRSMVNVSDVAMKLGELKYNKDNIIDIEKVNKFADKELLIMTTGSQGESMSALSRMASGELKGISIGENDCIILSSSPIPGNEKAVYNIINKLFKMGADVIYDELADVHVSGHACQEEIKMIHSLVKPTHFIPVHGEYRHLKQHKELAIALGTEARNIIMPELGMQIELSQNSMVTSGYVQAGIRLVDGLGVGDLSSAVLRDRKQLAEEGVCIAVVNLSTMTGEMITDPFIITRGVVYNDEQEEFNQEARTTLSMLLKSYDIKQMEQSLLKNTIKKTLSNFIFKKTKRRPMILTVVLMD